VYVADLVRAKTEEEFQRLCAEYAPHLTDIPNHLDHDAKVLERLKKEFAKAGLVYQTGRL
jgi:predicted DNA binding CopG/RHH family protein